MLSGSFGLIQIKVGLYYTECVNCIQLSLLGAWNLTLLFQNKSCFLFYKVKAVSPKIQRSVQRTKLKQLECVEIIYMEGGEIAEQPSPCSDLYESFCRSSASKPSLSQTLSTFPLCAEHLNCSQCLLRNQLWPLVLQTLHEISGILQESVWKLNQLFKSS